MIKKILLGLAGLLLTLAVAGWWWFRGTAPILDGELRLTGLRDEVQVSFDDFGVPHIQAKNEHDAYLALGFVHAQDRLFQMEMLRRVAAGKLSEVLGTDLLPVDKLFRTLGISQIAEINAQQFLGADTSAYQQAAHAYLKGVNAFIEQGQKPLEFTLTGIPLTRFEDKDIFLAAGYMAFSFAEAIKVDPVIEKLEQQYPGYAKAAFGSFAGNFTATNKTRSWNPQASNVGAVINKLSQSLSRTLEKIPVPLLIGSNGWAISGKRTQSGKPILANDTHIGYAQPAVWYEAYIEYPGFQFYGHHIAGIPFGVLGRNPSIAWGITMFENDEMDFYVEKGNPQNPMQVRRDSVWEDLLTRTETIHVKDATDLILTVKTSRHGPLMNGVTPEIDADGPPISLWWAFLHQPVSLIEAFYRLNHANGLTDASRAVSMINAPGLNIIYSDTGGNIAWWAAAKLPRRTEAFGQSFRFLDGSNSRFDHTEWFSFSSNPQSINPPWGYVHSGNNQPDTVKGEIFPGYYYPRDRAGRIEELLTRQEKWTLNSTAQMQLDHRSPTAPLVAKALAEAIPDPELATILNEWDGSHELGSVGPTVYYNLLGQVIHRALGDEIGADALKELLTTSVMRQNNEQFIRNDSTGWWDDVRTPARETRSDIMAISVRRTRKLLERECGKNPKDWTWEKVHYLKHKHPLGAVPLLDRIFSVGTYPVPGGLEVINNLMFALDTTGTFPVIAGPALRKVHDLSATGNNVTVSPSGQSGNVASEHYDDQAELFATGKTRAMGFNGSRGRSLLMLLPAERKTK